MHPQHDLVDLSAFGGGESHFRRGARLARTELPHVSTETLRRIPISRSGNRDRVTGNFVNTIAGLLGPVPVVAP